jgi:hypothetical protein
MAEGMKGGGPFRGAEMTGPGRTPRMGRVRKGFRLMSNPVSQLAKAAFDTLHGTRGLPPAEAVAKLHDFLESIDTSVPDSPRFADALVLLSQKVAFCELGIVDKFGRFVFGMRS